MSEPALEVGFFVMAFSASNTDSSEEIILNAKCI